MTSFAQAAASRRKFLQFLAGSPLLAGGALRAFAGESATPGAKLPDPLMWGPMRDRATSSSRRRRRSTSSTSSRSAGKNVPPAHFGYMASGIDDEVTLRANREGFLKFQLRPRRLRRRQQGRHERRHPRASKYSIARSCCAPVGGQRSFHDEGEVASRAPPRRATTCKSFRPPPASGRGRHRARAARRSGISSTPPTSGRWRRPW